jgi:hypothetical protein
MKTIKTILTTIFTLVLTQIATANSTNNVFLNDDVIFDDITYTVIPVFGVVANNATTTA